MRALFPMAAAAMALTGSPALADFTMTILHTNDFHARFEPISEYDSTCAEEDNAAGECFGGSARLVTAIEDARERAETPLLVDGGDQFQGTLYFTQYKGAAAAEMMNRMGYDAMTVGNHEFDDGPEVLAKFIRSVEFPVLLANAEISGEGALAEVVQPSAVIERGGERIGLIGLTPENAGELSSPGPDVTFTDPARAVQAEVDRLTDEGVNKIVVLSHSGYGVDRQVARATDGVDVIVGGHTNTYLSSEDPEADGPYPTMVGDTAIVQAYAYGKYLGELTVTFDDAGVVTKATGEPRLLDSSVAEDAATKERLAELAAPLEEIRAEVVGTTAGPINSAREDCRTGPCEMGTLVADAMLDRVEGQGIDVAITNGGGLRASIDEGEVTMGEVLTTLPFQNTLATFRLKGSDLRAALENGVSKVEEVAGRFPQVAGMRFRWDPSAPAGERITEVTIGSGESAEPLDPDATYGVVSNNFMRGGGDGYAVFAEKATDAYDYGPGLETVLADYLEQAGTYEPHAGERIARE